MSIESTAKKLNLSEGQVEILRASKIPDEEPPREKGISASLADRMPQPKGYKILIAVPKVDEKSKGGILRVESERNREEVASIVAVVVSMGEEAYTGKKFPSGPYCKAGDFIMMRSYSGTRFTVNGEEMRLINDDSVEAVIIDPSGIEKA